MHTTGLMPLEAKSVIKTVDRGTHGLYGISMSDFLSYVRKRRADLQKELADLETAERVFREAPEPGGNASGGDPHEPPPVYSEQLRENALAWAARPKTIKEMVLRLLTEAYPSGLTALEILEGIQKRWMPGLERTSLSPQLTRLKNDALVVNRVGKWFSSDSELAKSKKKEKVATKTFGAPPDDGAPNE